MLHVILCYYGNRKPSGRATGMKLGGKSKDVDSFVDQIRAEGGGQGRWLIFDISCHGNSFITDVPPSGAIRTNKAAMATVTTTTQQQQRYLHMPCLRFQIHYHGA